MSSKKSSSARNLTAQEKSTFSKLETVALGTSASAWFKLAVWVRDTRSATRLTQAEFGAQLSEPKHKAYVSRLEKALRNALKRGCTVADGPKTREDCEQFMRDVHGKCATINSGSVGANTSSARSAVPWSEKIAQAARAAVAQGADDETILSEMIDALAKARSAAEASAEADDDDDSESIVEAA